MHPAYQVPPEYFVPFLILLFGLLITAVVILVVHIYTARMTAKYYEQDRNQFRIKNHGAVPLSLIITACFIPPLAVIFVPLVLVWGGVQVFDSLRKDDPPMARIFATLALYNAIALGLLMLFLVLWGIYFYVYYWCV